MPVSVRAWHIAMYEALTRGVIYESKRMALMHVQKCACRQCQTTDHLISSSSLIT